MSIPGVGYLTATAMYAAVGNAVNFRNGRELAAWLGITPREHSTGGKQRLLGITKRGDCYSRKLIIHGARISLRYAAKKKD
jgi:transposase